MIIRYAHCEEVHIEHVIDPFGHITPNIQINTDKAHQTLVQLLHALDKLLA